MGSSNAVVSDGTDSDAQDIVFDLLSSSRRRYVLYYLRVEKDSVKLTDLADEVASWEYETPIEELTERERKRSYVSLYQTHVPKLNDSGFIVHDPESGMLTATERVYIIDRFLPGRWRDRIRWERLYLVLSLCGMILFAVGLSSAGYLAAVPVTATGVAILSLFCGTSIVHFIYSGLTERPMLVDPNSVMDN